LDWKRFPVNVPSIIRDIHLVIIGVYIGLTSILYASHSIITISYQYFLPLNKRTASKEELVMRKKRASTLYHKKFEPPTVLNL
jgi:hypothetical protein